MSEAERANDGSSQATQPLAAGVRAALADRGVQKEWSKLIARAVAKGVFYGSLAVAVLTFVVLFAIGVITTGNPR